MVTEEITPELIAQKLAEKGVAPEKPVEAQSEAPAELSIEDQARAVGWRPEGPESAEIFLAKKPLFEAIKARGKEVKELAATVNELKAHLNKQEAAAYKRALAELKAERRQAISLGDIEAVEQIDESIGQMTPVEEGPDPAVAAAVSGFVERNSKWINDPSMEAEEIRQWVRARDVELVKFKLDPAEHFARIEAEVKKKFNYDNEDTPAVSRVESEYDSAPVKGKKKVSFNDLSKEQKDACRHFEKRGIMKADEYIKQLQDLGEI